MRSLRSPPPATASRRWCATSSRSPTPAKSIVDDIRYPTEPAFQNGVIAQAIGAARHQFGVSYFSSAGNQADQGFEQEIHWVKGPDGRMMANFDPGSGVDTRMDFDYFGLGSIFLQWDDPYNGVTGALTVDLDVDLFERDSGIKIAGGGDDNFATGVPLESMFAIPDHYSMELYVANRGGAQDPSDAFQDLFVRPAGKLRIRRPAQLDVRPQRRRRHDEHRRRPLLPRAQHPEPDRREQRALQLAGPDDAGLQQRRGPSGQADHAAEARLLVDRRREHVVLPAGQGSG